MSLKKSFLEKMGLLEPDEKKSKATDKPKEIVEKASAPSKVELKEEPSILDAKKIVSTLAKEAEEVHAKEEKGIGIPKELAKEETKTLPREKELTPPLKEEAKKELMSDILESKNLMGQNIGLKEDYRIGDKLDLIIGAYEKNKLLTIEEIYRNARLEQETKRTIFMADVFLKAIPTNLPSDVKRETVLNIMNVSNIDLDDLLNDAYKRIDSLNTVLEETVATTQEVFKRNDSNIAELEKRIEDLKQVNVARKQFQEDQNTMIEYEIQKIINLVEFVKPKKS